MAKILTLIFLCVFHISSLPTVVQGQDLDVTDVDEMENLDKYSLLDDPNFERNYPPPNDQIVVPPFWDVFRNLPEDWGMFKNMVVAKENRPVLYQLGYITAFTVATDYESWQALKRIHDDAMRGAICLHQLTIRFW